MRYCLLLLIFILAGCAQPEKRAASPPAREENTDAQFNQLANEYLSGYLAWRPGLAVTLGYHEYDGKVTDYSRASVQIETERLKKFDQRLTEFKIAGLSPRALYDFQILQAGVRKKRFKFEQMQSYTRNPMTYADAVDVLIYIKRDFAPLDQRVHSIIAILRQTSNMMAAARANLDRSVPRPYVETAIQVGEGSADFLSKDLVEALSALPDKSLKAEFALVNQRAVAEVSNYVAWLKSERLPAANNDYALGTKKYAEMLRDGELITFPPERILEIGLQQLKREQQTFAETAKKIDPARPPIEVFKAIQKDHPTEQSLIPDTKKNLEAIRQFVVDRSIITIPSPVRARVEETPRFERATSFASMDTPGPFETKATEAYYYVTPVEPDWTPQQKDEWLTAFNYYTTDIVSIHEAYPGHYVQFLCLNASPANRLEKILGSYAFEEGWAHYTEQMMLDEGFGPNMPSDIPQSNELKAAKYRLAQSDEALLRLCRLCVSVKMHCQGMTVDEATRFLMENCYYEEKPARQEAIRGTFDPEYLYYTVGKLQILKLRADWQKQEGARYSLKKFHDELLSHGMPPLLLLREVMLKDQAIWPESF
jgi:uncharacterized protein (DUF885 family)